MHDNVRLLRALVNGASITALRKLQADPDTGKKCWIFWLGKTLLALEWAKLKESRDKAEPQGGHPHMRMTMLFSASIGKAAPIDA